MFRSILLENQIFTHHSKENSSSSNQSEIKFISCEFQKKSATPRDLIRDADGNPGGADEGSCPLLPQQLAKSSSGVTRAGVIRGCTEPQRRYWGSWRRQDWGAEGSGQGRGLAGGRVLGLPWQDKRARGSVFGVSSWVLDISARRSLSFYFYMERFILIDR